MSSRPPHTFASLNEPADTRSDGPAATGTTSLVAGDSDLPSSNSAFRDSVERLAVSSIVEQLWRQGDPGKLATALSSIGAQDVIPAVGVRYLQVDQLELAMLLFSFADTYPQDELLSYADRAERDGRLVDAERARAAAAGLDDADRLAAIGRRMATTHPAEAIRAYALAGAVPELLAIADRVPFNLSLRALRAAKATDQLISLGRTYEASAAFGAAIEAYAAAGVRTPLESLGDRLTSSRFDRSDAIAAYTAAGATDKLIAWGDELREDGQIDEAARLYRAAGARERLLSLARTCMASGRDYDTQLALQMYRELESASDLRAAGSHYLARREFAEAAQLYREAARIEIWATLTTSTALAPITSKQF